jgi:hypothetical protein
MSYPDLQVEVDGDLIIVSAPETQFIAIYAKPSASAVDPAEAHRGP